MAINSGDAGFKVLQTLVAVLIGVATIGYYEGIIPYIVAWPLLTLALIWVTFPFGVFVAAAMREINKSIKRRYWNA